MLRGADIVLCLGPRGVDLAFGYSGGLPTEYKQIARQRQPNAGKQSH